jgi:hypothetical protein
VAARQGGAISRPQLDRLGVGGTLISRWAAAGRLHRVHPGVYAVGHPALPTGGRVIAALLYAGPGSVLSHTTAAWWWRILRQEPRRIHVSVAGKRRSLPAVAVHEPRELVPDVHRGLPVTSLERTLVDLAALVAPDVLRRAVAEADYLRLLDPVEIIRQTRRGRKGSAALRRALGEHFPELARTLSVLEERFLSLCERAGLPMPEVNATVAGLMVDAVWEDARLVVELDGHAAHARAAAIERYRGRELTLRSAGYIVLRYTWQQVTREPATVVGDLRAALAMPKPN